MKTLFATLTSAVLIFFLFLALPISGEEQVYESVVRLHVLPTDDTREAQDLKLLVRDALLSRYGERIGALESKAAAEAFLVENKNDIESYLCALLEENGSKATATVSVSEEYFDTREYNGVTLPAGTYTALTVKLDEGKGQNWWCVLYPSLCTEAAMGDTLTVAKDALSESEYKLVTDEGYLIKLRTLELLEKVFGK